MLVFLNQTMPIMATAAAVRAANGLMACSAEKEVAKSNTKVMKATKTTPVLTAKILWLISVTSQPQTYVTIRVFLI